MKTMTCKQLGGPCDLPLHGDTADEVIKAQDRHLKEMVAGGDETHKRRLEGDEGQVEASHVRNGVVQEHQARFCCPSRRLIDAFGGRRAIGARGERGWQAGSERRSAGSLLHDLDGSLERVELVDE